MSSSTGRNRTGAIAGVAFALFFFIGVASLEVPRNASSRQLVSWWSDSGHQRAAVVSMLLFTLAGLCFLIFLSQLRRRLFAAEGGAGDLSTLIATAGTVFVTMLFLAAAARGVIGFSLKSHINREPLPGPDTLRYLPQIGYTVTATGGMLAAALTIAVASIQIARTDVLSRWLAWVGGATTIVVVIAVALLAGVYAIPAVLVWALATSAVLWRAAPDAAKSARA